MSPRRFDALVVGAGPAGSIAALVLARAGASVALLDKAQFPRDKACGDFVGVVHGIGLGLAVGIAHVQLVLGGYGCVGLGDGKSPSGDRRGSQGHKSEGNGANVAHHT